MSQGTSALSADLIPSESRAIVLHCSYTSNGRNVFLSVYTLTLNMYFQAPSSSWRTISSSRGYNHTDRKRKRKELEEKDDLDKNLSIPADESFVAGPSGDPNIDQIPILTPDDIAQYKVAGQPLTKPLPVAPFPHVDRVLKRQEREQEQHGEKYLSSLSSTLGKKRHQREQHLSGLTVVLHRCLLQRDFGRARRALGLILRTEINGSAFDLRTGALWGVGAEILMRHNQQPPADLPKISRDSEDEEEVNDSDVLSIPEMSRWNLEMVKRYLEGLSVQYGYHTTYPRVTSAVDFKLALMELWVYFLQNQVKRIERAPIVNPISNSNSISISNSISNPISNPILDPILDPVERNDMFIAEQADNLLTEQSYDEVANILMEVRDMLREFETLMQAPTYSNRLEYLRLYIMVIRWKGDLCRDLSSRRTSDADSPTSNEGAVGDLEQEAIDSRDKADELWVKIHHLSR